MSVHAASYVLISRSDFLGFGERLVTIRWRDLRATGYHELNLFDVSAQALKALRGIVFDFSEPFAKTLWRDEISGVL